jgi:hypothetical protein
MHRRAISPAMPRLKGLTFLFTHLKVYLTKIYAGIMLVFGAYYEKKYCFTAFYSFNFIVF